MSLNKKKEIYRWHIYYNKIQLDSEENVSEWKKKTLHKD